MKKPNKNQDRIEKLKGLKADKESESIADLMIDEAKNGRAFPEEIITQPPINVKAIIKLNEELTAENSRLLEELDGITADKNSAEKAYDKSHQLNKELSRELDRRTGSMVTLQSKLTSETEDKLDERNLRIDLDTELSVIKSKWWYKLMAWGW